MGVGPNMSGVFDVGMVQPPALGQVPPAPPGDPPDQSALPVMIKCEDDSRIANMLNFMFRLQYNDVLRHSKAWLGRFDVPNKMRMLKQTEHGVELSSEAVNEFKAYLELIKAEKKHTAASEVVVLSDEKGSDTEDDDKSDGAGASGGAAGTRRKNRKKRKRLDGLQEVLKLQKRCAIEALQVHQYVVNAIEVLKVPTYNHEARDDLQPLQKVITDSVTALTKFAGNRPQTAKSRTCDETLNEALCTAIDRLNNIRRHSLTCKSRVCSFTGI